MSRGNGNGNGIYLGSMRCYVDFIGYKAFV